MSKRSTNRLFSLVSTLLGVAFAATAVAYLVWHAFSERAYREKWKDYNDCGLM